MRLRFHHPLAYCSCPSFGLSDYDGGGWVYAVFPDDVPSGHQFEGGKYYGSTRYELVGHFSGRLIDAYGWAAVQNDVHGEPVGGEDEGDRKSPYPEFCVEDWCYRPDPDPVLHKSVMTKQEIAKDRAEYAAVLAEMKRVGAKLCPLRSP